MGAGTVNLTFSMDTIPFINATTIETNNCYILTEYEGRVLYKFEYWIGDLSVCILSIIGIILTLVFVCIFFRSLSNPTTFHHLMVVLFLADCVYLFLALLHRIEILFEIELVLLTIIYPTFTYPMSSIILTMSIYLTVAMAHERYIAIKNPLSHQRDMMSSKYRRRMLFKYLFFIVLCAVGFNFTKFFEAYIVWEESSIGSTNGNR